MRISFVKKFITCIACSMMDYLKRQESKMIGIILATALVVTLTAQVLIALFMPED